MDNDRARELLAAERAQIEEALREAAIEPNDELSTTEMADDAAVERAEERIRQGTYGRSVESGKPIPDERLEVSPTAERTVEEEEHRRRGG